MNIIETAQAWASQDPDTETRTELQQLIDSQDTVELEKRFAGRLEFGTAGLRGKLQAGPMGMNRVLVAQAAAGLARYLLAKKSDPSIVIGYDARKNSKIFAQDTAEIMQAAGVSAQVMPDLRPTPVLAFAVRHLNTSAGVMVTASHNPPEDNGYKVYLGDEDDGAQIVAPSDSDIAHEIQWVADNISVTDIPRSTDYGIIDTAVIEAYKNKTIEVVESPVSDVNYVYTAMHGIGTQTLLETLYLAGLPQPVLVNEQCEPDPTFATVAFPNPEEAGALDLAIAKAKSVNADFIIANDPDADRLAVAIADEEGTWKTLHGNEIGLLLGWHVAQQVQAQGKTGTLACSMVSSPVLGKVAQACNMAYQETLTGFKYIGRIPNLIFGFEEAIGYLVNPDCAHDKDGISAALCFLDLINKLAAEGKTFKQYRQEFVDTFGACCSDQISIRVEDLSRISHILTTIRQQPMTTIGSATVDEYIDHLTTDKKSNILVFNLTDADGNHHRVICRPSGTEPKLKIYIDTQGKDVAEAERINQELKSTLSELLDRI